VKPARNVEKLIRSLQRPADAEMHRRILNSLLEALQQRTEYPPAGTQPALRRIIMKSPVTKLAVAAALALAVLLPAFFFLKSTPSASAAQVFYQAAEAMGKLKSFHTRVEKRTLPGDNFVMIDLEHDFVPIDFWRQFTDDEWGKWRLEEPGRVVVMDGTHSTMLIKPDRIYESVDRSPERYWPESFVELGAVMTREARKATEHPADFSTHHERGEDGRDKVVITVEAQAKVPKDDHLRNKYIEDSDHLKIYRFDAETKLLEELHIYVHTDGQDVLVYRLVQVEYNIDLDPGLFHLEPPENAIYLKPPEILPDNKKYEDMTPKEAATAFFTACANEDWDEVQKFLGQSAVPQRTKDHLGGLTILDIGEPFQSAGYTSKGWLVPYKIRFKSGRIQEHTLGIRKDNPANRFEVDGGI
jgi:outer membrane lipoprotein-sorting protein